MAAVKENSHTYHGEDGHGAPVFDFTEQSIRKGFIRKVYAILMIQLLLTMVVIAFFSFYEPMKAFVTGDLIVLSTVLIVGIVCVIVMALSTELRRTAPMNFIFLAILTIAQSILMGILSCLFEDPWILVSVGISAAVCLAVTIFAFQTKWDFTMIRGWLIALTTVLLFFGILVPAFPDKMIYLGVVSGAALIFCLYLVYDTQAMVGGKHIFNASPKECIFAVLNLYLYLIYIQPLPLLLALPAIIP